MTSSDSLFWLHQRQFTGFEQSVLLHKHLEDHGLSVLHDCAKSSGRSAFEADAHHDVEVCDNPAAVTADMYRSNALHLDHQHACGSGGLEWLSW